MQLIEAFNNTEVMELSYIVKSQNLHELVKNLKYAYGKIKLIL